MREDVTSIYNKSARLIPIKYETSKGLPCDARHYSRKDVFDKLVPKDTVIEDSDKENGTAYLNL